MCSPSPIGYHLHSGFRFTTHSLSHTSSLHVRFVIVQGDPGGNVNIWRGDIIGLCGKKIHMNMRLNLNGYEDTDKRGYFEDLGVDGKIK